MGDDDCDTSAGIIRIRFAGRRLMTFLSACLEQAPRANPVLLDKKYIQPGATCQVIQRTLRFHSSFSCNCRGLSPELKARKSAIRRLNLLASSNIGK
jgi:hypothetical protein